jgi:hypothetical protein
MENLLCFARDQPELQFLLLTPQDMTAVGAAKEGCARGGTAIPDGFVNIVYMPEPRPGARRDP